MKPLHHRVLIVLSLLVILSTALSIPTIAAYGLVAWLTVATVALVFNRNDE